MFQSKHCCFSAEQFIFAQNHGIISLKIFILTGTIDTGLEQNVLTPDKSVLKLESILLDTCAVCRVKEIFIDCGFLVFCFLKNSV